MLTKMIKIDIIIERGIKRCLETNLKQTQLL